MLVISRELRRVGKQLEFTFTRASLSDRGRPSLKICFAFSNPFLSTTIHLSAETATRPLRLVEVRSRNVKSTYAPSPSPGHYKETRKNTCDGRVRSDSSRWFSRSRASSEILFLMINAFAHIIGSEWIDGVVLCAERRSLELDCLIGGAAGSTWVGYDVCAQPGVALAQPGVSFPSQPITDLPH